MKLVITNSEVQVGIYRASHADFLSDYGSAPLAPARPNCTCAYERNVCHASQTPGAQRAGGPRIWPEGDAIIAAHPLALTSAARRTKPRLLPPALRWRGCLSGRFLQHAVV